MDDEIQSGLMVVMLIPRSGTVVVLVGTDAVVTGVIITVGETSGVVA